MMRVNLPAHLAQSPEAFLASLAVQLNANTAHLQLLSASRDLMHSTGRNSDLNIAGDTQEEQSESSSCSSSWFIAFTVRQVSVRRQRERAHIAAVRHCRTTAAVLAEEAAATAARDLR